MLLTNFSTLISLIIADLICIIIFIVVKKTIKPSQLKVAFLFLDSAMIICCTLLSLQIMLSKPLNIAPIYFDYFVYIGNCVIYNIIT